MIIFTRWSNGGYGIVSVNVDGKEYTYQVDAAMIPAWKKRATKAPGKVFNEIKKVGKLIDSNVGKLTTNNKKEITTMSKAASSQTIISTARAKGYVVETAEKVNQRNGKLFLEIVKYECPDCHTVYRNRLKGKEPIKASFMKAMKFTRQNSPTIVACQCGYRKVGNDETHGSLWKEMASSTNSDSSNNSNLGF